MPHFVMFNKFEIERKRKDLGSDKDFFINFIYFCSFGISRCVDLIAFNGIQCHTAFGVTESTLKCILELFQVLNVLLEVFMSVFEG